MGAGQLGPLGVPLNPPGVKTQLHPHPLQRPLCMLSSQGRVPVGPQAIVDWPLEMARTTPAGGEAAQIGVLVVWGVAKQTRIPESTGSQRLGARLSPRCPGLDLWEGSLSWCSPDTRDIAAGWGVSCANTCAGEARKPRPTTPWRSE